MRCYKVLLLRRRYPLENAVLVDNFRIIKEARLINLKLHLFALNIFNVLHIQNLDKFGRIIGLKVLNLVCNNRIRSVSVINNSVFLIGELVGVGLLSVLRSALKEWEFLGLLFDYVGVRGFKVVCEERFGIVRVISDGSACREVTVL